MRGITSICLNSASLPDENEVISYRAATPLAATIQFNSSVRFRPLANIPFKISTYLEISSKLN